jgi:hypothetical protein
MSRFARETPLVKLKQVLRPESHLNRFLAQAYSSTVHGKRLNMAKNELPGNRVAYASGGVAGEGSPDRNQRLTEVSLPHPDLTLLARAQGSEAHPPEQEGQWPIDLPRVPPPPDQ